MNKIAVGTLVCVVSCSTMATIFLLCYLLFFPSLFQSYSATIIILLLLVMSAVYTMAEKFITKRTSLKPFSFCMSSMVFPILIFAVSYFVREADSLNRSVKLSCIILSCGLIAVRLLQAVFMKLMDIL